MKLHVFDIRPFEGVGPIRLGMTRQELRRVLGGPVRTFRKVENAPTLSDQFLDYGSVAFYTENDRLDAFEFYEGTVEWNGIQLMGRQANEVFQEVKPHSKNIEIEAGFIFHDLGFALYVSGWGGMPDDDDENVVEAVLVFSPTHYRGR